MIKIYTVLIFISCPLLAMDMDNEQTMPALNFKQVYKKAFCDGRRKKIERFAQWHVCLSNKRDLEFIIEQGAQINRDIAASGIGISSFFY